MNTPRKPRIDQWFGAISGDRLLANVFPESAVLGKAYFTLKELKRLRVWLDNAIKWIEYNRPERSK